MQLTFKCVDVVIKQGQFKNKRNHVESTHNVNGVQRASFFDLKNCFQQ